MSKIELHNKFNQDRRKFLQRAIAMSGCFIAPKFLFSKEKMQKDKLTVAAYYFPNWGPVNESEWEKVKNAKPMFPGHLQPKVPLWGYENENLPSVMEKKIEAAAEYGVDVFVFDWYIYDKPIGKYLSEALEDGFLNAKNNSKIKFALMWCNHDASGGQGIVKPVTFETDIMDYIIDKYFKHPSYWQIDGCPYFSIYLMKNLISTYDNDLLKTAEAIELFREKVKKAGFKDLHLNSMISGIGGDRSLKIDKLKLDSIGSYHMLTNIKDPATFPIRDYTDVCERYFTTIESGGGKGGLEKPVKNYGIPYHLNVSMGYDTSPRCKNDPDWMNKSKGGYPYGPVTINNTPKNFKRALEIAKKLTMKKPENEQIIMINSWNEWGEGSYLEPDTISKMKYLEAIRDVCK